MGEIIDVSEFYKRFPGNGNVITLDRGDNTTCTVNTHGAQVCSWRVRNIEQLFVCRPAVFDRKKVIRGGVPLVFPKFRHWTFGPRNGFASVCKWDVEQKPTRIYPSRDIVAVFSLVDSEYTRSMWDYSFKITYTITLREKQLHFQVNIANTSTKNIFNCQFVFHNYFKVADVAKTDLHCNGLANCSYFDVPLGDEGVGVSDDIKIGRKRYDKIFKNAPDEYELTDKVKNTKRILSKSNIEDTVVWNPWEEQGKELLDFWQGQHINMLGLQFGCIFRPIHLHSEECFVGNQNMQFKDISESYSFMEFPSL